MRTLHKIEIKHFNNFNNDALVQTKSFYNFLPTTKLNNSMGIDDAKFPLMESSSTETVLDLTGINQVNGVTTFKQYFPNTQSSVHRVLVYGEDNKVYINQLFSNSSSLFWLYNLQFNSAPICLQFKKNDADAVLLTSEDKMMIWKVGLAPYQINNAPIVTSMAMNDGVLYCTVKDPAFKVWYCTDLDAENVGTTDNYSGYISLEDDLGDARKIVTLNESVYVFRDYGISKISLIKKEISVSQIYASNTKIFTNTVSTCGNIIMFMTVQGLFSFNGVKVSKSKIDIANKLPIRNEGAVASSLGDRYYLALRLNFDDNKSVLCETETNFVNNALIVVDNEESSYQIMRGVDIACLQPIKTALFEKMLVTFNTKHKNKVGQIVNISTDYETALPKFWKSEELCTANSHKMFTKLSVNADANVTFKLIGKKTYTFVTTHSGVNIFKFKIYEDSLCMEISSSGTSAMVNSVLLEYYEN